MSEGAVDGWQRHAAQWVLVEARSQLLAIGKALYSGTSPRSALDSTARRVLLPRMRQATVDGARRHDVATHHDHTWITEVVPIIGPVSGQVVAVLGCYARKAEDIPAQPLIGTWEWQVTPPGPDQVMRTYWSESLFDVYGLPKPESGGIEGPRWRSWEGPQWLDELIVDSDRADMRRVLDAFLRANTDALFIHSYRTHNPRTGEIHRLRLAGRSYVADHQPKWFRGISMRLDDHDTPADGPPGPQNFIDAAFALSRDPLCAVDTEYEHIYMTSTSFGGLGIALPAHRHLPEMCHPDDLATLRRFLHAATERPGEARGPVGVRFSLDRGGWRTLMLTGTAVRLSEDEPHHVLCRVTAVSTDPG